MVDCRTCEHYHAEFTDVLSIRVWCDAYNDTKRMMNSNQRTNKTKKTRIWRIPCNLHSRIL